MLSLGIDVGVAKGLDLVLLDGSRRLVESHRGMGPSRLGRTIAELAPDVVAIDSPPAWARRGRSRVAERELSRLGLRSYAVPTALAASGNGFYDWMRVGIRCFAAAARAGYPRYRRGPAAGTALEVFPHASGAALAGRLPAPGDRKTTWRRGVLRSRGVDVDALSSPDQIDAALAALTGVFALRGAFSTAGDPDEGVIVVPAARLPAVRYVAG